MIEVKLDSAKLGKIIILINYGKTLEELPYKAGAGAGGN